MNIEVKRNEGKIFLKVIGRIDTTTAVTFQTEMETLLKYEAKPDLEVDCTELLYTSSQGLRVFLLMQKTISSKEGSMVLKNMKPEVKEVFDITGFANIIKII